MDEHINEFLNKLVLYNVHKEFLIFLRNADTHHLRNLLQAFPLLKMRADISMECFNIQIRTYKNELSLYDIEHTIVVFDRDHQRYTREYAIFAMMWDATGAAYRPIPNDITYHECSKCNYRTLREDESNPVNQQRLIDAVNCAYARFLEFKNDADAFLRNLTLIRDHLYVIIHFSK
jgi:hypothetical protein